MSPPEQSPRAVAYLQDNASQEGRASGMQRQRGDQTSARQVLPRVRRDLQRLTETQPVCAGAARLDEVRRSA